MKWDCIVCTTKNMFAKTKCQSCGASKTGKLPNKVVQTQSRILSQYGSQTAPPSLAGAPTNSSINSSQQATPATSQAPKSTNVTPATTPRSRHPPVPKAAVPRATSSKTVPPRSAPSPTKGKKSSSTPRAAPPSKKSVSRSQTPQPSSQASVAMSVSQPLISQPLQSQRSQHNPKSATPVSAEPSIDDVPSKAATPVAAEPEEDASRVTASLFQTASGKPVTVARTSLQAASRFALTDDEPEQSNKENGVSSGSENRIVADMFQTAGGKAVTVSAVGLKRARDTFSNEDNKAPVEEEEEVVATLFEKADGSPIRVSQSSLEIGKRVIDEEVVAEADDEKPSISPEKIIPSFTRPSLHRPGGVAASQTAAVAAKPVLFRGSTGSGRASGFRAPKALHPQLHSGAPTSTPAGPRSSVVYPSPAKPTATVDVKWRDGSGAADTSASTASSRQVGQPLKKLHFDVSEYETLSVSAKTSPFPNCVMHFSPDCTDFEFPIASLLSRDGSEDLQLRSLLNVSVGEDGLPTETTIAPRQFRVALLALGAQPKGCSAAWVENAISHEVWLFCHNNRPDDFYRFTPAFALSKLVSRYNSEYVEGNMSILRRISEKDAPSTSRMIVYLVSADGIPITNPHRQAAATASSQQQSSGSNNNHLGGGSSRLSRSPTSRRTISPQSRARGGRTSPSPSKVSSSSRLHQSGKGMVSDGLYTVSVNLDGPLMSALFDRTIQVGDRLDVWGASSGNPNAAHPLELTPSTILINLGFNGVTCLPDDTNATNATLGAVEVSPTNFPFVPIRRINPLGGVVPSLVGVVTRVLPPHYQETVRQAAVAPSSGKSDPNSSYRAPKITRNETSEMKHLEKQTVKKESEYERRMSSRMSTGSNNKNGGMDSAAVEEVGQEVNDSFARDVSEVTTIIVEDEHGDVAVVQQWLRGGSRGEGGPPIPKEGSRIRMYNLHPGRSMRPVAPFHGKMLYARPTFSFLEEPLTNAPTDDEKQMFAFERKVHTSLEPFEGSMRDIMVDICCIAIDTKTVPSGIVNQSLNSFIFCASGSNIYGSLEIRSSPHFEISLSGPPKGTACIIQNCMFSTFDSTSGSHNVVRFHANEYTRIITRSSDDALKTHLKEMESHKAQLEKTITIGDQLLQGTFAALAAAPGTNAEEDPHHHHKLGGDDSPSFSLGGLSEESSFLLKAPASGASPHAFLSHMEDSHNNATLLQEAAPGTVRGPSYLLNGRASNPVGRSTATPTRPLFDEKASAQQQQPQWSLYNNDDTSSRNLNDASSHSPQGGGISAASPLNAGRQTASPNGNVTATAPITTLISRGSKGPSSTRISAENTTSAPQRPTQTAPQQPPTTANDENDDITSNPELSASCVGRSTTSLPLRNSTNTYAEENEGEDPSDIPSSFSPSPSAKAEENDDAQHNITDTATTPTATTSAVVPLIPRAAQQIRHRMQFAESLPQKLHLFGNIIPESLIVTIACGPTAEIRHKIVSDAPPQNTSLALRARRPSTNDTSTDASENQQTLREDNFFALTKSTVMTHGISVALNGMIDDGAGVEHGIPFVCDGADVAASLMMELVGAFTPLAASVVDDGWFQLSLQRSKVLNQMDSEQQRWKAFILQSVVVEGAMLSLYSDEFSRTQEERGETNSRDGSAPIVRFDELAKVPHWNHATVADPDNLLWWYVDEWASLQRLINAAIHMKLVNATLHTSDTPLQMGQQDQPLPLVNCVTIREHMPIGMLAPLQM